MLLRVSESKHIHAIKSAGKIGPSKRLQLDALADARVLSTYHLNRPLTR